MEDLLRKYLWALDAATVGLCAALLALSASAYLESRSGFVPPSKRFWVASHATPAEPRRDKRPDAILRRNIFCSTCPPIRLHDDPDPTLKVDGRAGEAHPTTLPLKLVAVMYAPAPERQEWNMAVIRNQERGNIGAFEVGARLEGATLVAILDTRAYLDLAGDTEYLDLLAPPKNTPAPPAAPASPPKPPTDPFVAELERGTRKIGERQYEVRRSTLESVMGKLALLSRSARIVPDVRGGKAYGFRLFAVKPGGPFAKIGLQNGDVIVSLNGLKMTSPEKALEVYGKLKSASHLALGLERGGQKVAQDYIIR